MKKTVHAALLVLAIIAIPVIASTATTKEPAAKAEPSSGGSRQFSAEAGLPGGETLSATIVASPSEEGGAKAALSAAISAAQAFYNEFFGANGVASQLEGANKGNSIELSPAGFEFMKRAVTLSKQTDGFFDIAGPSPKHLFIKSDSRRIDLNNEKRTISLKSGDIKLDLGRIALGYACDLMMDTIAGQGFGNASVTAGPITRNIGRDIYTPWDIVIGFGENTSTGTHRAYRYGVSNVAAATVTPDGLGQGLIDPLNKKEVNWNNVMRSVTVMASNATNATAFALAAYTVGPDYAMKYITGHTSIKGIVVDGQGNLTTSKNLVINGVPYEKSMTEQTASDGGPNDQRQKEREEKAE